MATRVKKAANKKSLKKGAAKVPTRIKTVAKSAAAGKKKSALPKAVGQKKPATTKSKASKSSVSVKKAPPPKPVAAKKPGAAKSRIKAKAAEKVVAKNRPSDKIASSRKTANAGATKNQLKKTRPKSVKAPVKLVTVRPATHKIVTEKQERRKSIVNSDSIHYQPSDAEAFMNDRQTDYFRRKLVTWKDDILRESRETLTSLQTENENHPDFADRASSETDRAIELRARDRQRKLISKIDSALTRLEEGSYGYCEETGEPISLKRLDARPIATLSIEAQERHERREKVYRDD